MEAPARLIDAYRFCPICGSEYYARLDGVRRCEACGHTNFNNPIASVAVWILDADRNLLLIERANDPGNGKLAPPGGFLDAGETLEGAAKREVHEEVGLTILDLEYLGSYPYDYLYRGLTCTVCDTFFTARAATLNPV
ncbi:MAG: NUDIX hydrolase, partial [Puniceicoccales bacterium]